VYAPVPCYAPDLCTISACAPDTGQCVDTPILCPDGQECNPDTGACVGSDECEGVDCDDGNECTDSTCVAGMCVVNAVMAGEPCDQGGGSICDGDGNCVGAG
jgi:hypothetical protein